MRSCLALLFGLLVLVTGACSSPGDAVAMVAEGIGGAVAQEVLPLQQLFGTEDTAQPAGIAHAHSAGLRMPRGLRGLREPRPFGTSAQGVQQGLRAPGSVPSVTSSPTVMADTTPLAAYNQATGDASVQLGASSFTWSSLDRSLTIQPATRPGLYGTALAPGNVNYDPVTGVWTFQ